MKQILFNSEEVLENNTNVSSSLIDNFKKLEDELNSIGVKTKSQYRLNHPLKECKIKSPVLKNNFYVVIFE